MQNILKRTDAYVPHLILLFHVILANGIGMLIVSLCFFLLLLKEPTVLIFTMFVGYNTVSLVLYAMIFFYHQPEFWQPVLLKTKEDVIEEQNLILSESNNQ